MEVTRQDIIKDCSGNFACPNCESAVTPINTNCNNCAVELEWPYDAKEAHNYWVERKARSENGVKV